MYVASWSGGKDSTATILLAHENNEPLDLIIFSEVMFDKNISGETPEHIQFVYNCIKKFKQWGYETKILHSNETYLDCFYKKFYKSKVPERNGMYYGFPMAGRCKINDRCKVKPIRDFNKNHPDAIHYIGIAIDEPKRLARLKPNCISLLQKYNMTEQGAYNLCKKYNMLSPHYEYGNRGGVGFVLMLKIMN